MLIFQVFGLREKIIKEVERYDENFIAGIQV